MLTVFLDFCSEIRGFSTGKYFLENIRNMVKTCK